VVDQVGDQLERYRGRLWRGEEVVVELLPHVLTEVILVAHAEVFRTQSGPGWQLLSGLAPEPARRQVKQGTIRLDWHGQSVDSPAIDN